jgi:uncharacterized membrane protein YedE/YeeE
MDMMPIHPSTWVGYTLAVLFGFAFGFVLERAGFGSARKLAAQFYLTDMRVLKVMFTAIVTALLGLTFLRAVGVLDWDELYINPTYLGPQVVGGLIFGVGFVIGGYCPGTCVVAATTGKLDAVAFLVGIGGGVIAFSAVLPRIQGFAQAGGERRFLYDWLHLPYGVVAIGVTLMALGMFVGAELIERKMAGRTRSAAKPTEPASEQTQSA